ncbi:CMGC/CDK/CDK7 protein kinase [Fonticula alba]|uniref:[RNA-polymerase]-subunit kinase n=1 Tax=Fonticula alba TaxID=691883 RepID=A0A058Z471_FONAL|nr:CMGC/CDK/CDK7 protein kinase [Fonticula alba]KCV68723.1 CMGC/CDK/CDK7 protein kinase [Fonticula alba]|eukprot:XP_009497155.1 CMGC/CDK/CDK7 protein kinase [Fonticula alba]
MSASQAGSPPPAAGPPPPSSASSSSSPSTSAPASASASSAALEPGPSLEQLASSRRYRITSKKLGSGTFGDVYLGVDSLDDQTKVAIKRVRMTHYKTGLDITALREVRALREMNHVNVIQLLDAYIESHNMHMVLEFLDHDLKNLIEERSIIFSAEHIKSWMLMTLRGVHHCHVNGILHRDLKPDNLLISAGGVLKVADFGLARHAPGVRALQPGAAPAPISPNVVTRFYRSPELLLGARVYSFAVDIWSVGCIFAELFVRTPYFTGEDSDISQLMTIYNAMGTPDEASWPGISTLPGFIQPNNRIPPSPLGSVLSAASKDAISLMEALLVMNPLRRISAEEALRHPYFSNLPRPSKPADLPNPKQAAKAQAGGAGGGPSRGMAPLEDPPGTRPSAKRSLMEAFDQQPGSGGHLFSAGVGGREPDLKIEAHHMLVSEPDESLADPRPSQHVNTRLRLE